MLDDPDLDRDKMLSEHVMRMHSRNRKRKITEVTSSAATSMKDELSSNASSRSGFPMRGKIGGTTQNPSFKEEQDDLSFMKSAFNSQIDNE
jgi:hypothetical protein